MQYEFKHKIECSREKSYYSLEFEVPDNIESVDVCYRYDKGNKKNSNIVDLGLEDSNGVFLGWSGSARGSVTVGECFSTEGYLNTPITPGRWKILIGAYKISAEGVLVTYNINCTEKKPKLLFGDLHMHSTASDGQYNVHSLAKKAKKAGLDFIAVTNHNNYAENFALPREQGLTLIPAVEWTHYNGHMNFFGVKAPFTSFAANSEDEMQALIKAAKNLGALISVNHPKCSLCPYLWNSTEYDLAEIWNGPMRCDNLRAIEWWTQQLKCGRRLPCIGGSDFHRLVHPVRLAHPVTAVFTYGQSKEEILNEIKNGHCFITNGIHGPKLKLSCKSANMGDSICFEKNLQLKIKAEGLKGARLILVSKNEQTELKKQKSGEWQGFVPVKDKGFTYLKAVYRLFGREYVSAITNPIYFT